MGCGKKFLLVIGVVFSMLGVHPAKADEPEEEARILIEVQAPTKTHRDAIAQMGFAIDGVTDSAVTVLTTEAELKKLDSRRFRYQRMQMPSLEVAFPNGDAPYHDYAEMKAALDEIVAKHPEIAKLTSIGKSIEGREIYALRLSASEEQDVFPTSIFLGCHHAREHLSVEVPLKLAQYLAENYAKSPRVQELLGTREIWIVPMVNPDGAEYDIASGRYRSWRKNRRQNGRGSFGVDLNRNYGGQGFGGAGSSSNPNSDTYRGPQAFSEPETQAVRDFVRARTKAKVLLSYHTFSELILWPRGYTNAPIENALDRQVFETMGRKMATWNGYRPMQSSQLYVASGDTTDWAYEELKIFAFTFELTPASMGGGGFYPGAAAIESTFKANLEPALYLIEQSIDPYSSVMNHTIKTSDVGTCPQVMQASALSGKH